MNVNLKRPAAFAPILFCLAGLAGCRAESRPAALLVDINEASRSEKEVNESGYVSFPFEKGKSGVFQKGEVSVRFVPVDPEGALASVWYKKAMQNPHYARLASDGVTVADGDAGAGIEMRISGLGAGKHTLLTYHNTMDDPKNGSFSPLDVFVNGEKVVSELAPGNRVLKNADMPSAYVVFEVDDSQTETAVRFVPVAGTDAGIRNVVINGFEIDTPNAALQAREPVPSDGDEHADADAGWLALSWTPAPGAVSHDLYFGTDAEAVAAADRDSDCFLGNRKETDYRAEDLYGMDTYFWRVDEVGADGTVTPGRVWRFRPRQLAFPGAEGYGRFARGGRGGKIVKVTNLNDDGPGSLREALTADIGPRIVVFDVSGIITLKSRLAVSHPYVTIAGQTAPGKGICIRQAPLGLSGANDVVVQHVRVRLGKGHTYDGMGMSGCDHCIIDHGSISWTLDEAFSSRSGKNITLQRTLISEALNAAGHKNYKPGSQHGYAGSISGDIGSFHHNLLAHCSGRNWSLAGGLDGDGFYSGRLDIFNNVVYNWQNRTTDGGAHEVNFVNNYYKPGPATKMKYALNAQYDHFPGTQRYYVAGNVMPGVFGADEQEKGRKYSGTPQGYSPWVDAPFFPSHAEIHTAEDAYKVVLSDVGCNQPLSDNHDRRILAETMNGTTSASGSVTGLPGLPDSEEDVGGWEDYPEVRRPANWDSDGDGLPDWWEKAHGLEANSRPGDFSDPNGDPDRDGYTHMDAYLAWMGAPHVGTAPGSPLELDLSIYTRGFTQSPTYSVVNVENGTARTDGNRLRFVPGEGHEGLASVTFEVKDAEGSAMQRTVGIYVGNGIGFGDE